MNVRAHITFIIRGKLNSFENIWRAFINFAKVDTRRLLDLSVLKYTGLKGRLYPTVDLVHFFV